MIDMTAAWRGAFRGGVLRVAAPLVWPAFLLGLLGCGGDAGGPVAPARNAAETFWALEVNARAVTLSTVAPYDTFRVVATARNAYGDMLGAAARADLVTDVVPANPTDPSVTIEPGGLLRAHSPVTGARVIVRATLHGVARADTLSLNVTTGVAPTLARLVLTVTPTDSISMNGFFVLGSGLVVPSVSVQAVDAGGHAILGAAVALWSADTTLATVDPASGMISIPNDAYRFGRAMVYASATAYGVTRTDSLPIHVTPPTLASVDVKARTPRGQLEPVLYFAPDSVTVMAGGLVVFGNPESTPIDVVFDDSSAAQEIPAESPFAFVRECSAPGNILRIAYDPAKPCSGGAIRVFARPGKYRYHSTAYGTHGVVVVPP